MQTIGNNRSTLKIFPKPMKSDSQFLFARFTFLDAIDSTG
jgi:hypothetical protein